ncbi:hypothetical protein, partial [Streptomyces sp. BE147]|uniref:hypothetical protein n=1 Tax=Streptomyces sp. BE147 TaxID=3002524 RepID=UPI002E798A63
FFFFVFVGGLVLCFLGCVLLFFGLFVLCFGCVLLCVWGGGVGGGRPLHAGRAPGGGGAC